jgi:YfiH family protein
MIHKFSNLSKNPSVQHFITTRNGGYSSGNFESLNLSTKVGDDFENVKKNRNVISKWLKVEPQNLFFPDQCHTANIKIISNPSIPDLNETDALITGEKGIGIGVLAADCFPVLFFDPSNHVISAAHAGWRGTIQSIVSKVVKKMCEEFGSDIADILVGIGPGISQKNYEVDESVIREVDKVIYQPQRFYEPSGRKYRYFLNLRELNKQMLVDSGVKLSNIELMNICTFENNNFFSARRNGFNTGRFGAVISLA